MSLVYAKNEILREYNTLKGDHKALLDKYRKLSINTQNITDQLSLAEKEQKMAENNLRKAESELKAANFTISAETDELRNRMEKEHKQRKELFEAEIKDLYRIIKENSKLFERLKRTEEATRDDLLEMTKKWQIKETEITTTNNKMSTITGKVVSAKNRITSLNASTPYRPGAVERTLADVMDDLKNV